jgi:hypothetical protein
MAFNYWFHPPDVCEKGKHLKPYASAFWERKFAPLFVAVFMREVLLIFGKLHSRTRLPFGGVR